MCWFWKGWARFSWYLHADRPQDLFSWFKIVVLFAENVARFCSAFAARIASSFSSNPDRILSGSSGSMLPCPSLVGGVHHFSSMVLWKHGIYNTHQYPRYQGGIFRQAMISKCCCCLFSHPIFLLVGYDILGFGVMVLNQPISWDMIPTTSENYWYYIYIIHKNSFWAPSVCMLPQHRRVRHGPRRSFFLRACACGPSTL